MKKHLLSLCVAILATSMSLQAQTIVINDGFEDGIQDSIWTQEYVVGQTAWMVESVSDNLAYPSSVVQGTHRAYLRNMTGETQGYVTRLVSKEMDLSPRKVYQPYLSFWYANPKWTQDRDTLRVLYRTSRNAKWKQLAEYGAATANWQKVNLELPEVNETYQIAFEGTDNLGRGIVLDSILLRSAPDCTVPSNISVSNKGAGRVRIAWSASWDANYFEIIVSKDTIDPNAIDEVAPDLIAYHGQVSGLQKYCELALVSGEYYFVYVRSLCEEENSLWSSEVSKDETGFRVRETRQVPYFCDFNLPSSVDHVPDWVWGNNTGKNHPYVNSKMTNKTQLGYYSPDATPCVIFSGTSAAAYVPAGSYAYLATPALSDSTKNNFALNQCQVRFWSTVYIYTGRQYGRSLIVGVMDNPDDINTFEPIDTISVWGNKTFQENIVDLSSYTGTGAYVAFVSDFDRMNHFFIDNVTIEYRPAVNKVTKIDVNPRDVYADISWEGNAASYNVLVTNAEVDPANPDASAVVAQTTVNTNSYHCTGLEADHSWNRPYYVYVQAAGTEWSYGYSFVTIAAKRDIPYSFGFESNSPKYRIGNGSLYYPTGVGIFGNDPKYPSLTITSSGTNLAYRGTGSLSLNKTAGADSWITLPMVDNLDSAEVKFYLSSGSASYRNAHAAIGVMSNPMDINTFTKIADFKLNAADYMLCYANFENYHGPDGVIAITWDDVMGMSENTINYIDEVSVNKLSECVPPANITLDAEHDSVTVSWSASNASMWDVVISTTALTTAQKDMSMSQLASLTQVVTAQTVTWTGASDPVFTFGGLRRLTDYIIYIRTNCGAGTTWWVEQAFSTPCPSYPYPFKDNFETYAAASTTAECWQLADYIGTGYPKIVSMSGNKVLEMISTGTLHRSAAIMPQVIGNLSDMMLSFEIRSVSAGQSILYVGSMADIEDYSTFVPFATIQDIPSDKFKHVFLTLADYPIDYDNIAFTTGLGNGNIQASDVYIDNVALRDPNCIEPYDVTSTAHSRTADITWNGLSPNNQWEVKVTGNNQTILDTVVVGMFYHITGLEPQRQYDIAIRGFCGDSIWAVEKIETSCEPISVSRPYKETFESYEDNETPRCWIVGTRTGDGTPPYISTVNSKKVLHIRQSTSYSPYWAATPEISCDSLTSLIVSYVASTYNGEQCVFGVMVDPGDLRTFVPLDSASGTGQSNMATYTYDLSQYATLIPPTAKHLAWRGSYGDDDWIYIDEVSILSSSCPLTNPSVSNVMTQSAVISSGLTVDNPWHLLVTTHPVSGDSLVQEGYRVPDSIIVFNDLVQRRSTLVDRLSPRTQYYVATSTDCDSTSSPWSTTFFTTPCGPITPEDLGTIRFAKEEGYITGTTERFLPCWTIGSKKQGLSVDTKYIPYIESSTTYQFESNNSLRFYTAVSANENNNGAYAVMPELDVDSIYKYQVNLWGRGNNSYTYGTQLIVGVVTDPTDVSTFVPLDTVTFSRTEWTPMTIGLENYMGDYFGDQGKCIMFMSEFASTNDAYISEISVERIPRCRPIGSFSVDSVSDVSAIVSWKGYQDAYRVLVSKKILSDAEKSTYHYVVDEIVDHSRRVLIEGLSPGETYYVYAQGICGPGDSTLISASYAVVETDCPVSTGYALPFFDDFEKYPTGSSYRDQAGCWTLISGYSSYPYIYSLSNYSKVLYMVSSTSTYSPYRSMAVMPKINGNFEDLLLSFDMRQYSTSYAGTVYVGAIADPEDPSTFVPLDTITAVGTDKFTHFEVFLADYEWPYDRIAFTTGFEAQQSVSNYVYIDNVKLELATVCRTPKLKVNGSTTTAINISITPAHSANTHWDVVAVPDSIVQTLTGRKLTTYLDTTSSRMHVDTVDVSFTGLTPGTAYQMYARTACGGSNNSEWTSGTKYYTKYYYTDSYFFGFEKNEGMERSIYSSSDAYYLHPALMAGRDPNAAASTSYTAYPYSRENTVSSFYSLQGKGSLVMQSNEETFGQYIIFPAIAEAKNRSFSFSVRSGNVNKSNKPVNSYNGVLELGSIDINGDYDTYQHIAMLRLDSLHASDSATAENNYLFTNFTIDLDASTMAAKQLVLYAPQPEGTSYLYIDSVALGAPKGVSLVSIDKVLAEGTSATIEWANYGGPWNLYITHLNDRNELDTVAQFLNLTVTSKEVLGLTPRTDYTVILSAVTPHSEYSTSTSMKFTTTCPLVEPDANGAFVWNFDDENEWEPNDVLSGTPADSLYLKPSCFNVGITYETPSLGYQWLVQRKGFDYYSTAIAGTSYQHYEVGRGDSNAALRVHTSNSYYNSYIVLPQLNCNFDTMMVEFYGRCFVNYDETYGTASGRGKIVGANYLNASYSHSMVVGTLTDPSDFSTLQIIDTLTYRQTHLTNNDNVNTDPTGLRYWELMQASLAGATGKYIVLFQPAAGLFILDDLSVKPIGNTLFAPSGVSTSNITASTALMSWSVKHPTLPSVVVVLNNAGEEIGRDTVSGTSYTASNLHHGTSYQWYVYQTDLTRNSQSTLPVSFATECVAITPDYTCGFELEDGWSYIPGQTGYTRALCWTYGDAAQGTWKSATYDPFNQANTENFSYSHTDSFAVVLKASYSSSTYSTYRPYIAMPALDTTAYDTLQVSFWMRPAIAVASTGRISSTYTGNSYSKSIIVGTMTDPEDASTFVAIDTVTYNGTISSSDVATAANNYLFQQKKVELAGAKGPYVAFMTTFYAKGSTSRQVSDYVWLDDIALSRRQECKAPTNLSNDKVGAYDASLSWQGPDSALMYLLQVSKDPYFVHDTALVYNDTVYAESATITGLEMLTSYTWRVLSLCGDAWGESDFSNSVSFKTARTPYYLADFSSTVNSEWMFSTSHADNIVDAGKPVVGGNDQWGFARTAKNDGLEGPHYVASGNYQDYHWMITPDMYLPENDSAHFSLDIALTACNTNNQPTANAVTENDMKDDYYFMIILSDDGGQTWKSENILGKWQNTNPEGQQLRDISSTGQKVRYSLASYAGKHVRIGFYREAKTQSSTGIAIHVDNARFAYFNKSSNYVPSCQFEDVIVEDLYLSGEDLEPGLHVYPKCFYASDEAAKAGARDSVHAIEVDVFETPESYFSDTICQGETYSNWDFIGKTRTGVYHRKLKTAGYGCDSIATLYLYVKPTTYAEDVEVGLCPGETYRWNGRIYNRTGVYRDTLVSSIGCDSIETLVLSYYKTEDTIKVSASVLTSELPYSYVNEDHPYVPGQAPVYYPVGTAPGTYSDTVRVEGENCVTILVHRLRIIQAQGIDNIFDENAAGARKLIYRDNLYIILNDEWYNAEGKKVADPRK